MNRAVIIDENGTVEETSGREFFSRIFGHPPRTKEQRDAEYRAELERHIKAIDNGLEALVPPPYLYDCYKLIELREQVHSDPLPKQVGR